MRQLPYFDQFVGKTQRNFDIKAQDQYNLDISPKPTVCVSFLGVVSFFSGTEVDCHKGQGILTIHEKLTFDKLLMRCRSNG